MANINVYPAGILIFLAFMLCPAMAFADDAEDCQRLYNGHHRDQALAPCLRAERSTGNASVQVAIGYLYDMGLGVPVDKRKAFSWYMKAAQQGDTDAQAYVANAYQEGQGASVNLEQARSWYLKAAKQNSELAQLALGEMFGKGLGVTADPVKAEQWFVAAANHRNPKMMRTLGIYFLEGDLVQRDPRKAAYWYKNAAVAGDVEAQISIAMLLNRGLGIETDKKEALLWFKRAAENYVNLKKLNSGNCTSLCMSILRYYRLALEEAPPTKVTRAKLAKLALLVSGESPELTAVQKESGKPQDKEVSEQTQDLRQDSDWIKHRYWRSPWLVEPPAAIWEKADPELKVFKRYKIETQPVLGATYEVEFDLSVINYGILASNDQGLHTKLQTTADLLATCGIRLRHAFITDANTNNDAQDFVPGSLSSPHAVAWVLPVALQEDRDAGGVASIANLASGEQPVFHIGEINKENEPFSTSESRYVWPHEVGHLIGEMGHPDDLRPSVMHYYALTEMSFTTEQCERMRKWPWMYQYQEPMQSYEWPRTLTPEEGQDRVARIDALPSESDKLEPLRQLLLGTLTSESPDTAEEYAFASLIEHFYNEGLYRQGFYLEMLWERRHGFTIADALLEQNGIRPSALTRELAATLRDDYMHTRPEDALLSPAFWSVDSDSETSTKVKMQSPTNTSDAKLVDDRRQAVDVSAQANQALGAIGTLSAASMSSAQSGYLVSRCLVLTNKSSLFPSPHLARIMAPVSFRPAYAPQQTLAGKVVAYGSYAGKMYDANDNWALVRLDKTLPLEAPTIPLYQMSMEQMKDRALTAVGISDASGIPYSDSQCKAEGLSIIRFTVAHHCQATLSQTGGALLAKGKDDRFYAVGMITDDPWTTNEDADEVSHHQGVNFIPGKPYDLTTAGDRIVAVIKGSNCGE